MGLDYFDYSVYILQCLPPEFDVATVRVQHLATRVLSFGSQSTHFAHKVLFSLKAKDVNRDKRLCISHNGA